MHPRHSAALIALLSVAIACGDSTSPTSRLGINLSVDGQPDVTQSIAPDGQIAIRCDVTLIATARNTGTTTWADGMIRFYFGRDRKVATDSVPLSVSDVQATWGKEFKSGVVSRSNWYASADVPFDAEFEFHFADGVEPAKTRFTCGPPLVATNEPPSVTSLSVLPASGTVQAGDTLRITYSATAPGTLWSTAVKVTGPFPFYREYPEGGVAAVTHTVQVVVPAFANFDIPITVSASATDPGLVQGTREVETPLTVVDLTPPTVRNAWIQNRNAQGTPFFVGDTIQLDVDAWDNNLLDWFVWDVTGAVTVHDSVQAPAGTSSRTLPIPLIATSSWVGTSNISVYVRDGTGAASAPRPAGAVQVSPTFSYAVSAVATAPASSTASVPGDAVFDAKRGKLYVTFGQTNDVQVLDVATAAFGAPIALSSRGVGLDLTPGGDSLLVAEPDAKALAVVNLSSGPAVTSIPLTMLDTAGELVSGVHALPTTVRVAANGSAIVQLSAQTRSGDDVLSVPLGSGAARIRSDAREQPTPLERSGVTPDRSRVVLYGIYCMRTYVASSDTFTACGGPNATNFPLMSFSEAGDRVAMGSYVLDLSFNALFVAGNSSGISVLSPDGATMHLAASNHVLLYRVSDGALLGRYDLPFTPQVMVMAPGGEWLMLFRRDDVLKAARVDLR